jgi:hypothetical protein
MLRLTRVLLAVGAALLALAGCADAPELPATATAPLVTATARAASATAASALPSASVISIQTSTPSRTPIPLDTSTPLPSSTPSSSATETQPAPTTDTATAAPIDTTPPPATPTVPPGATAVPISIVSFSISPQEINPGQSVTLSWEATGQVTTLYRLDALGRLAEFFNVPMTGSLTLPTPAGQRSRVDFMLFTSTGGSTASASVSAAIRCPDVWFFANPPALCPASPPNTGAMAAERFEHGLMLWTAYLDRIYILYGDGTTPAWDAQSNTWFPGQPESDPSLTPPAGLYQPVRGFGALWRNGYVSPSQVVRDRLGWATEAESALSGSIQCDSAPKYNRCYLTGPANVVYVLEPERSAWKLWQGP